jgi:hypothetical protein
MFIQLKGLFAPIVMTSNTNTIPNWKASGGEIKGIEYAPIKFDIADNLSYWSAEISGIVLAKVEALTGPTTPPGKRVQTINPPGSEVRPGAAGAVATWGTAVADEVDVMGFKWERKGRSSKHIPFEWSGP